MTFRPNHFGLYFDKAQLEHAQKNRTGKPLKLAWENLSQYQPVDELETLFLQGLNYRLGKNPDIEQLAMPIVTPSDNEYQNLMNSLAIAQVYELLREHPSFTDHEPWQTFFSEHIQEAVDDSDSLNQVWYSASCLGIGVVLEDESLFETGVNIIQDIVSTDIHPDGYIRSVVESENEQTFFHQVLYTKALALAAEIAFHAGNNLWQYEVRGVSITTAIAYLIYYYFYPEKWRWGGTTEITLDETESIFKEHGAFMEIVYYRTRPRGIEEILKVQRPMVDFYGGGFITLTHGNIPRRGLFG